MVAVCEVQKTDRVLICYRIVDPNRGKGARLFPGRWNTEASPTIYTSEHYSTAMLEKLVNANSVMPPNQHYTRSTIPNGMSYEIFQTAQQPGWDAKNESFCKAFGQAW